MNASEKKATICLSTVSGVRMLGLFMLLPVLPLYAGSLSGATPWLVGLAMGIYGFPQAILQIPAGSLSDQIGRKPVIVGGLIIFAIGTLIAAMSHSITGIIVGRFFQGAGAIASATIAFLTDLTSDKYRTRAMAVFGMSIGIAFCIAMVIGPFIATSWGGSAIFWLTLLFCFCAIIIVIFFVPNPIRNHDSKSKAPSIHKFKKVLCDRQLIPLICGVFILHFTLIGLFMLVPLQLENQAHLPLKYHGWIYLGVLIISFIAMVPFIIISEKKHCLREFMIGAISLLMIAILSLTLSHHSLTMLIIGVLLYFTAFNFLEACLPSMLSKIAHPDMKGATMGIYSSCQFLGAGLGGIFSGLVLEVFGYQGMMFMCSTLAIAWLILAIAIKQTLPTQGKGKQNRPIQNL